MTIIITFFAFTIVLIFSNIKISITFYSKNVLKIHKKEKKKKMKSKSINIIINPNVAI